MPAQADSLHVAILSTMDIIAMLINAFYIFVIVNKTPKSMAPYSILLFNTAFVDLLAAFCSCMCITRMTNVAGRIVMVYLGPCTLLSAQWCHLFFAGNVDLVGNSIILLVLSFYYRLRMFKLNKEDDPRREMRIWTLVLSCIFGLLLINTFAMFLGGLYEAPGYGTELTFSVLKLTGETPEAYLTSLSVFLLISCDNVGFLTVFSIRRKLNANIRRLSGTDWVHDLDILKGVFVYFDDDAAMMLILSNLNQYNSSDRYSHRMIYHSLTAQMLLPLAYVIGSLLWFIDFADVFHSHVAQRSVFILCSIFALASPLINMCFIPPYRKYLESLFFPSRVVPVEASSTSKQHSVPRS